MIYCRNCGNLIDRDKLFCPYCGNRIGAYILSQKQYAQDYSPQCQKPFWPNSNMAFAIMTTFLFCLPIGIIAVIFANRVDELYELGEYEKAEMAAIDAKKWSILGTVIGVGFWIVLFIGFILCALFVDGFWEGFINVLLG